NPGVVTRFRAVLANALKPGTGILIERPSFWAVISRGLGAIQRSFAFSSIETRQMAARQRCPDHAMLVDIGAANSETRQRHVVNFRQRGLGRIRTRIDPHDRTRKRP